MFRWGNAKYFAEDEWERSATDKEFNAYWESQSKQWYQPSNWLNFPDQKIFTIEKGIYERYGEMLYYGLLMLFQNEMGPVNIYEFAAAFVFLMLSIFFNSLVFGDIYTAWEKLVRQSQDNQNFMDSNKEILDLLHIEEKDQEEIREYFAFTMQTRNNQEELKKFLDLIPPE